MKRGPKTEEGKKKAIANLIKGKQDFLPGFDPRRNLKGADRKLIVHEDLEGYNKRQIEDTVKILAILTLHELKIIEADEYRTILERTVARALIKGFEKGSLFNLETTLTRSIGAPNQSVDNNVAGKVEIVFEKGKTIL
jgi:hypothetical protein